tara:strand:- start:311 stop:733 length:423 start_codon:yes stop_codon:yes gene_type:complete
MLVSDFKMSGQVQIALNGVIVEEVDNLVVTAGKGYVADRMKNNSTVMSHMAVGTGTTAAAAGQTALVTEAGRVALASTGISGAVVTYTATFPAGTGTGALTEAAVLNASSSGTMLCRTVFSAVNKGANDAMTITWTITAS